MVHQSKLVCVCFSVPQPFSLQAIRLFYVDIQDFFYLSCILQWLYVYCIYNTKYTVNLTIHTYITTYLYVFLYISFYARFTGYKLNFVVFFPRILESLPSLPRHHSAAIGCTKNYQPIGVNVHSLCVESLSYSNIGEGGVTVNCEKK